MKLYYSPGACSLSPHIVARELGLDVAIDKVDREKKTAEGEDYRAINPKGAVPALALDEGGVLTEGAVIVQYLADKKPEMKLVPPAGTLERYRVQEWLNMIASDLHKSFSPLFNPKTPDEYKEIAKGAIVAKLEFIERTLSKQDYLMGTFSVADAYLFTILRWTVPMKISLEKFPGIEAFQKRMAARPGVHAAMVAEGLAR